MLKTTTTTIVNIKATTWDKDTQNLFDHESRQVQEKYFEASSAANILKINDEIFLNEQPNNESICLSSDYNLISINRNEGSFSVSKAPQDSKDSSAKPQDLWVVVKSVIPSNIHYRGHVLNEGDIIRLGKITLRVREIRTSFEDLENPEAVQAGSINPQPKVYPDFISKHKIQKLPEDHEFTCRICLEAESEESNPLLAPCSCSGSCAHIHLNCLKHWMQSKRYHKADASCLIYMWKDLECEVCHDNLPDIFERDQEEYHLVDLERPSHPYLILETMPEKKDIRKVFYVASVNADNTDKLLKLGRKSDCHVVINDYSVSRLHAMIKLQNGKFFLENGFSKFGTLLQLRDEIKLSKEHNLSIQVGKTVISFELGTKEVYVLSDLSAEKSQAREVEDEEHIPFTHHNVFSSRKSSKDSDEGSRSFEGLKSNLNDFFSTEDKNEIHNIHGENIQSELKHIDELIASMRNAIGGITISAETQNTVISEATRIENELRAILSNGFASDNQFYQTSAI